MTDFRFMYPIWLVALVVVPAIASLAWLSTRSRDQRWKSLVAPRLTPRLSVVSPTWKFWASLAAALLGFSLIIISVARPILGMRQETATSQGRNVMLLLDTSRSMRVKDVPPSRLEVARTLSFDCLSALSQDRVGIIAFANEPFVLAPLTIDHEILRETIEQLDHESVPEGGSNLGQAVTKAVEILKDTGQAGNAIILMSDGEDQDDSIDAAVGEATNAGIPILTIGIATEEGDMIPDPRQADGFFRTADKKPVISRLDESSLRALSRGTDGIYISAANMNNTAQLVSSTLAGLDRVALDTSVRSTPNDIFPVFLTPSILFLIASLLFRATFHRAIPPALAALTLGFAFTPQVKASPKAVKEHFEKSEYKEASQVLSDEIERIKDASNTTKALNFFNRSLKEKHLPQLHYARGAARYKEGKYEDAISDFSKALLSENTIPQADIHHSLANSLSQHGASLMEKEPEKTIEHWENAIEHYEQSLETSPGHAAATKDLATVKTQLEQLKKQQQEKQEDKKDKQDDQEKKEDQEQQDEGEKSDENQKDGSEEDQEKKDQGKDEEEQSPENKEGENSESEKEQQGKDGEQSEQEKGEEQDQQQAENTPSDQQQAAADQKAANEAAAVRHLMQNPPRSEETPQEYALRILKESSDLDKAPKKRAKTPPAHGKNW